MGYGRKIMEKCRVTAGLQTIPRLSGVMSRKGQHAQTLCHQPGILATLGHTKHVPLLPRHSVHQGVKASLLQEDLDLPDNQIMEHLDRLDKVEASDHQGIMGALVHQGKMGDLVHQGKMEVLDHYAHAPVAAAAPVAY